jgi:hypothetical protein
MLNPSRFAFAAKRTTGEVVPGTFVIVLVVVVSGGEGGNGPLRTATTAGSSDVGASVRTCGVNWMGGPAAMGSIVPESLDLIAGRINGLDPGCDHWYGEEDQGFLARGEPW